MHALSKKFRTILYRPEVIDEHIAPNLAICDNFVSYHDITGTFIELTPGTPILVDEAQGVGFFGDDHFLIWPDEYKIVVL